MYDFTFIESGSWHFVQSVTKVLTEPNKFFSSAKQYEFNNAELMLISKPLKVAKKFIQNMFNKSRDAVYLNYAQPNLSLVLIFMLGFQIDTIKQKTFL
jgi:hypothetical protein